MKFNPIPIALLALLSGARGAGELKRWLFFAGVFGVAMWVYMTV